MEQGSIRSQPRWLEAIKAAGVATSCVILAGLAWRIAVVFRGEPRWLLPVALLLGYASADVLSGTYPLAGRWRRRAAPER